MKGGEGKQQPKAVEAAAAAAMKRGLSFSMDKILSMEVTAAPAAIVAAKRSRVEEEAHVEPVDCAAPPSPLSRSSSPCIDVLSFSPAPSNTNSSSIASSPALSSSSSSPTSADEDQCIPEEEEEEEEKPKIKKCNSSNSKPAKRISPKESNNCSPGFITKNGITVELVSQELWKKFHKLGTEMIITKAGRRMFPTLKIRILGLDPAKTYLVYLELVPHDDKRYRYVYHSSQWMVAGTGDPHPTPNTFIHGDSPSSGQTWSSQGVISFDKLKLTNNRACSVQGQICLHSMHKYAPRVHVQEVKGHPEGMRKEDYISAFGSPEELLDLESSTSFSFPETVFTTVTAYQNQQITKLKIASNPFAKGFREATRTRDSTPSDLANSYYNSISKSLDAFHRLNSSSSEESAFALGAANPFLFFNNPYLHNSGQNYFGGALAAAAAAAAAQQQQQHSLLPAFLSAAAAAGGGGGGNNHPWSLLPPPLLPFSLSGNLQFPPVSRETENAEIASNNRTS